MHVCVSSCGRLGYNDDEIKVKKSFQLGHCFLIGNTIIMTQKNCSILQVYGLWIW